MWYAAYNKMYIKGKPTGRMFRVATEPTIAAARKAAMESNKRWNRAVGKKRIKAVLVKVKKVKG